MPEISRFLGMVIAMFYNDHAPPHFHVRYGEHRAIIDIARPPSGKVVFRRVPQVWSSSGRSCTATSCWLTGNSPGVWNR